MLESNSHKFIWTVGTIVVAVLLIVASKTFFPETWASVISQNFISMQPNLFDGSNAKIQLDNDNLTYLSADTGGNIASVDAYHDPAYGAVLSLTPTDSSNVLASSKKYPVYAHLSVDYKIKDIQEIPTTSTIDSFDSPTKRTTNFTSGVGLVVIDAVIQNGSGSPEYYSATAGIGNDNVGKDVSGTLDLTKELNLDPGASLVHVDFYVANIKAKHIVVDNPVVQIMDSNKFSPVQ